MNILLLLPLLAASTCTSGDNSAAEQQKIFAQKLAALETSQKQQLADIGKSQITSDSWDKEASNVENALNRLKARIDAVKNSGNTNL